MMRTPTALSLLVLLLAGAGAAVADGPYLNATGGVALVPGVNDAPFEFLEKAETSLTKGKGDWEFDAGFVASGAVGYQFGPVRADAEFSYLTANFAFAADDAAKDDTLTALLLLANFWYDVEIGGIVAPYAGIGAGGANLLAKLTTDQDTWFDGSGWGFAFQAGAGVVLKLLAGFSVDLGYRLSGSLATEISDRANPDQSSLNPALLAHRIQLGVRFPT